MIKKGMVEALLFPGQGSQKIGMGKDIYDTSAAAKAIFDRANTALSFDLKGLVFEGTEEDLRKTQNAQPALFVTELALWEMLREKGLQGEYTAGHSLGEFAALAAAGAMSFDEGITIVRERGLIMADSDKEGKGAMTAALGLSAETVNEICKSVKNGVVVPANYNSPDQVVISGEKNAVMKAEEKAKEAGAKRVVALSVSGAFHSPLMKTAADEFAKVIARFEFRETNVKVISNVTARPHDFSVIKERLVQQMYSPVRWVETIEWLMSQNVAQFIEVGPNKVLTGLMKKIAPNAFARSVSGKESFDETLALLSE